MSRLTFTKSTLFQLTPGAIAAFENLPIYSEASSYAERRVSRLFHSKQRSVQKTKYSGNDLSSSFKPLYPMPSSPMENNFSVASSSSGKSSSSEKCFTIDNINPDYVKLEYAVRGPLVIRAGQIEIELKKGVKKPFTKIIRTNIGDCQALGQTPITFFRQLLAVCIRPDLMDSMGVPEDVKERAKIILANANGGSLGSYTDSPGYPVVRRQIADFIYDRDGHQSNWFDIFIFNGATPGINRILGLMNSKCERKTGVMLPIPQYPLYSATLAEHGMAFVGYYLDEANNWGLEIKELKRALDESRKKVDTRAIVVINPGNPTGQVLTRDNIVSIIKFAHENKLCILADEVYQENIYDKNSEFFSFKKIMNEMGPPYKDMELVSFMSVSKGYMGECGIRGGYLELFNFDPKVHAILAKAVTPTLCSNTCGMVALSSLAFRPRPGEPSFEQFSCERQAILCSLKERAELIYNTMNCFEGFKINPVQGAMYAFPQITIPPKAIEEAKKKGMPPDTFYAFELLENAGVCVVPGSGFGQKEGTYHFRTTILPQIELLHVMMEKFNKFHAEFLKKYK